MSNLDINKVLETKDGFSEEFIASMVYKFAKGLPYSMDCFDDEFVSGHFINVEPARKENYMFIKNCTVYNGLIGWGDTKLNGLLLQMCYIFQTMIINNDEKKVFTEEDYKWFKFDKIISDEEKKRKLFLVLNKLPKYACKLNSISDSEKRRKLLDKIYYVMKKVARTFKYTNNRFDPPRVEEVYHRWDAVEDLKMKYYYDKIKYGLDTELSVYNLVVRSYLSNICRERIESGKYAADVKMRILSLKSNN